MLTSSSVSTPTSVANDGITTTSGSSLAETGIDLERDAGIAAALIAGGWAIHRWASRGPRSVATAGSEFDGGSGIPEGR
jgi:hypothetical protein